MTYQYYYTMQCAKCFRVCRLSDSGKTWVCTICKHREKANGGQAVSDTPRTEAEVNRQKYWSDDLITIDANFACQLERELNSAQDRIKRLVEAGDKMADVMIRSARIIERESPSALAWLRAKEDKI